MKVVRNPSIKVDYSKDEIIEAYVKNKPVLKDVAKFNNPPSEKEIEEKLKSLEKAGKIVEKIQDEIDLRIKNLEERENLLEQKEAELQRMSEVWNQLNSVNLKKLKIEDVKKILSEQKGFIRDLLEYYINAKQGKDKKSVEDNMKLNESLRENQELKKRVEELGKKNEDLMEEVDAALKETDDFQQKK